MDSSPDFDGFPAAGLTFLTELGTRDKAWFDANRSRYDGDVVAPTRAFVRAIGEALGRSFAPNIVAQPKANGSIAPINNDLRFSPDKSPYKDHLLLRFWEGADKKTAPTLFIRINESDVGFATGASLPDLERWRQLIDDDRTGRELADALDDIGRGRDLDVAGEGYKKVPKPYAEDHPRADLLRHKMFQARWPEPTPKEIGSASFIDWCTARLETCAPIHEWLRTNL
jgi:uncharacterized protein (TIGR02453 family)